MKKKDVIITVDLGWGDSGKGRIVDLLSQDKDEYDYALIVRYNGGYQSAHHVVKDGDTFRFSQIGSGSLNTRVHTYIGPHFIFEPHYLREEQQKVWSYTRNKYPLHLQSYSDFVDPKALVATNLQKMINRERAIKEKYGSCGMGIGECRKYWLQYGEDAIFAEDLKNRELCHYKYELMKQRYLNEVYPNKSDLHFMEWKHPEHLTFNIGQPNFSIYKKIIFEGSQGVLLDEHFGLEPPHVSWSNLTMHHAFDICRMHNLIPTRKIGISRCYHTRHGYGPFHDSSNLTAKLKDKELNNKDGKYQGEFRFGYLDLEVLKYAIEVPNVEVEEIAVTCCDHLEDSQKIIDKISNIKPVTITTWGPESV